MCNLKLVVKAILVLPAVLVLGMSNVVYGISGGMWSGVSARETLSLEDDFAVITPSADDFTAEDDLVLPSQDTIAIRAINPGYTTDSGKNAGELIELTRLVDAEIDLSHLAIIYTAKPTVAGALGKSSIIYQFPEGSKMIGDSILLRYRESPEAASSEFNQDIIYNTSLAMYGTLSLVRTDLSPTDTEYGTTINTVCWLGGADCLPYFSTTVKSRAYTTILRDAETGEYAHVNDPQLLYDPEETGLFLPTIIDDSDTDNSSANSSGSDPADVYDSPCSGLIFSEILSYYDDSPAEQFIELYNSSESEINLSECKVRYKSKSYDIAAEELFLRPDAYYVLYPDPAFRLTKNPTTENLLEIIDNTSDSSSSYYVVASLTYPHGQKKSTSYAFFGYNADGSPFWQVTFYPTPGEPNIAQEYKTCPAGKVINEVTGNCVNASTLSTTLKDCGEGKYRNPETGRCKSYDDDSDTPCKDGYERNPETNRCRKIKDNDGADFPVIPITGVEEQSTFIALWIIVGVMVVGIGYVVFQFRKEIWYFCRKAIAKIKP